MAGTPARHVMDDARHVRDNARGRSQLQECERLFCKAHAQLRN